MGNQRFSRRRQPLKGSAIKKRNPVAKALSTGIYPPKIINPEIVYKRNYKHKGEIDGE